LEYLDIFEYVKIAFQKRGAYALKRRKKISRTKHHAYNAENME
jgi:hypothetical protein